MTTTIFGGTIVIQKEIIGHSLGLWVPPATLPRGQREASVGRVITRFRRVLWTRAKRRVGLDAAGPAASCWRCQGRLAAARRADAGPPQGL
jgi:hypothetical protein